MNDHIHLFEAYAELLGSSPDPELRQRTEELLAFVRDRLFVEPGCLYFALHPDGGRPRPGLVRSRRRDGFLMIEAEDALGREPSPRPCEPRACSSTTPSSGLRPRARPALRVRQRLWPARRPSIQWWAQFEVVNALFWCTSSTARRPTGTGTPSRRPGPSPATPSPTEHPGVCPRFDEQGEVHCEMKSHDWFVSYHTARALLLTADRLRAHRP